jgi:hypothetical protein
MEHFEESEEIININEEALKSTDIKEEDIIDKLQEENQLFKKLIKLKEDEICLLKKKLEFNEFKLKLQNFETTVNKNLKDLFQEEIKLQSHSFLNSERSNFRPDSESSLPVKVKTEIKENNEKDESNNLASEGIYKNKKNKISSFILFYQSRIRERNQNKSNIKIRELMIQCGLEWRGLSKEEKQKWSNLSKNNWTKPSNEELILEAKELIKQNKICILTCESGDILMSKISGLKSTLNFYIKNFRLKIKEHAKFFSYQ